ncbi:methylenetetrahydrofolate--tRNA-(uracil-5-)-methyltransferase [Olsenella sp. KH1P3]|uniref:Methylenetetrahydrofolate--tRNA-(uracil-5-)-methyltransferase TrmFO n=1 Tax=Parafannyhessea umbonata TaxID=604330 RepID=A0A1H9NTQ0_9ACTN|nr:methylenetetrahydrofolate--tRNA-(uracil-5-)-methyltransferase [Parafannyhessea umbonata]SER39137.1 methylenetetrahydrofolate--tRNA-(uracil-5-)-methyltransferase [Parafannyhessea umbonata]SJZ50615.1 methylenetetrahydrofolate--tRNA-(uracil-5-)-methyltransferase [Olsenella sp. KH1P3]
MEERVTVIGGGLAGSECALQLAARGVKVTLVERRPTVPSPAHHTSNFAELVCSNSLKSMRRDSAAGLLKEELQKMGSFVLEMARQNAVPAGGALAVDRNGFSAAVTEAIESNANIEVERREVVDIPDGYVVVAAGPLCGDGLFEALRQRLGGEALSFYDAAAPIVDAESLDRSVIFEQSRYEESGSGDYLNCPMNKDEYDAFYDALVSAEKVVSKEFEQTDLFNACQPVEEVAKTGRDSLRFGALKPVGLNDPRTGRRPWAAVQLRSENSDGTAYNLVGFQTNLTWGDQRRVFRMIPGLENAEFFRYGVMHRNSFVDSPHVLDDSFAIPGTTVRLAGQITGTEGYTEAIGSGLLAALNTIADLRGLPRVSLPRTSAFGALVSYATDPSTVDYQPMHVNFGIVPPLAGPRMNKRERYQAYAKRASTDFDAYLSDRGDLFGP